jgi:hypothetical protein
MSPRTLQTALVFDVDFSSEKVIYRQRIGKEIFVAYYEVTNQYFLENKQLG